MTIESVAMSGAAAASPRGPKPGDTKPRDNGGTTANAQVPRNARRPRPEAKAQGPGPGPESKGGEGQRSRQDPRSERSLYDGGSPSANRLGPAKAMRARDVSRPRD
jgi:hypothetical protein